MVGGGQTKKEIRDVIMVSQIKKNLISLPFILFQFIHIKNSGGICQYPADGDGQPYGGDAQRSSGSQGVSKQNPGAERNHRQHQRNLRPAGWVRKKEQK